MRLLPWEKLQEITRQTLDRFDEPARVTVGSGSVKGNGDVISKSFMIECKLRSKKNIIIEHTWWEKLCKEAELLDRIPAIVAQNESGEVIISMKLSDFERKTIENLLIAPDNGVECRGGSVIL